MVDLFRGNASPCLGWVGVLALSYAVCGCREQALGPGEEGPRPSAQTGRYGFVTASTNTNLAKARPPRTLAEAGWEAAPFAVLETELSPATLIRCESSYLGLFCDLALDGMEGPSHVAFSSRAGPRVFRRADHLNVVDMEECWVVVWFAGARGWTDWDSPWAVFLQEKPLAMKLDETGLHLRFRRRAGEVVLMPLYGCQKLPPPGKSFAAQYGFTAEEVRTESWDTGLPRELLMRVRYWAGVARVLPIYCEDQFQVDRSRDTLVLRQRFQWHPITDAWSTRPIKLAPLSPVLALAARDGRFPVRFSGPVQDVDLFTAFGPYAGLDTVDAFDVTFPLLKYIHETERTDPAEPELHPSVMTALRRLQQTVQTASSDLEPHREGKTAQFDPADSGVLWLVKALPFCDPATPTNMLWVLRDCLPEQIRVANNYERGHDADALGSPQTTAQDTTAFPGSRLAERKTPYTRLLELLWVYADLSGDWELIRSHWDRVKKLSSALADIRWAGFGRDGMVSLGEQAAPCLALARMAYRVRDLDTYQYACYLFVRELVLHYVNQRGVDYFRRHQPWPTLAAMPQGVYLTSLQDGAAGWQIDGPGYPATISPGHYRARWLQFDNEDVARFYRDVLRPDMAKELDRLDKSSPKSLRSEENSWLPSLVQLRSLLLNLPSDQLAARHSPDRFSGPPSQVLADCMAVLRTSHPIHYERLIPAGEPGPFLLGLERDVAGPDPDLIQQIETHEQSEARGTNNLIWPRVTWGHGWRTPNGRPWTFGHVKPIPGGSPQDLQIVPLNWNSRILLYRYSP